MRVLRLIQGVRNKSRRVEDCISFFDSSVFDAIFPADVCFPFISEAVTRISSACFVCPRTKSHLGDSGTNPGIAKRRDKSKTGMDTASWR